MDKKVCLAALLLLAGCATTEPPITMMSIYNECMSHLPNNLYRQRLLSAPESSERNMAVRKLDLDWEGMCIASAKGDGYSTQANEIQQGQAMILGNQMVDRLGDFGSGRRY